MPEDNPRGKRHYAERILALGFDQEALGNDRFSEESRAKADDFLTRLILMHRYEAPPITGEMWLHLFFLAIILIVFIYKVLLPSCQ